MVQAYASEIAQSLGLDTVLAADAAAARRILAARTDIVLVFTDINMPGDMNGIQLAAAIRDRWPPIHLILTSGAQIPVADEMPARGVFLKKPYSVGHLEEALQSFRLQ